MSSSKVSLKLLIHKPSRKILFGQADKKFIDFLFTILALPIATIYNILSTETMVAPLRNLYHSLQSLDKHNDRRYATSSDVECLSCTILMYSSMTLVASSPDDKLMKELMLKDSSKEKLGYVKDKIPYMVMDDLTVNPMSAMSTISMLSQFGASICCSSTVLSDAFLPNIDFEDLNSILKEEEEEDDDDDDDSLVRFPIL